MKASRRSAKRDTGPARQFITKEFAETMDGKSPSPYLRLHDPVQAFLAKHTASENGQTKGWQNYYCSMLHFWREISLMGLPRAGRGADECYALLFESTFSLALARPEWAAECVESLESEERSWGALGYLAHEATQHTGDHTGMVLNFQSIGAVNRERSDDWDDPGFVARFGAIWFGSALLCATRVDENHKHAWLRRGMAELSEAGWKDQRIHTSIIREAALRSPSASRADLQAHPLIRMGRRNYREGSVEQLAVVEFLNEQCVRAGLESEEDMELSDLGLGCWVREARQWAARLRWQEPQRFRALIEESGQDEVTRIRTLFAREVGQNVARRDVLDTTIALIEWGHRRRGHDRSRTRGEVWEFILEVVDAALWLRWVFPNPIRK